MNIEQMARESMESADCFNFGKFAALIREAVVQELVGAGVEPAMHMIVDMEGTVALYYNEFQLAGAVARERERIADEWHLCVSSDLENGVKFLNEQAWDKWRKEYPSISGFAAAIRGQHEAD